MTWNAATDSNLGTHTFDLIYTFPFPHTLVVTNTLTLTITDSCYSLSLSTPSLLSPSIYHLGDPLATVYLGPVTINSNPLCPLVYTLDITDSSNQAVVSNEL